MNIDILQSNLRDMVEALTAMDSALRNMTCTEVDSIVRVVAIGGLLDEATTLVTCHALFDEVEGDRHERFGRDEQARQYVRDLMRKAAER